MYICVEETCSVYERNVRKKERERARKSARDKERMMLSVFIV